MVWNIGKKQLTHQGYSLGILIDSGNFGHILDLVETHWNISWGSEEHSVEVSAKHSPSYELADGLKYWKKAINTQRL